jgi:Gpi18-like mannosyltransferase
MLVVGAMALGSIARIWAQTRPGNWDFYQWVNTSNAVIQGQDPYTIYGYNYPPPWVMILALFNNVTSSDASFRFLIALLMITVDIGISYLLLKRGYSLAAAVFSLSPILIAISGQHQQVDGITVFLALSGMVLAGLATKHQLTRN